MGGNSENILTFSNDATSLEPLRIMLSTYKEQVPIKNINHLTLTLFQIAPQGGHDNGSVHSSTVDPLQAKQ